MTQTHSWMKRTESRFSPSVTQKVKEKEGEREREGEKGRKEEKEEREKEQHLKCLSILSLRKSLFQVNEKEGETKEEIQFQTR